jgi:hypothetical protein
VAFSLEELFWAWVVLGLLLIVSRFIRQHTILFRRIFLPSSMIAGGLALVLGPEVLPAITGWLARIRDAFGFWSLAGVVLVLAIVGWVITRLQVSRRRKAVYTALAFALIGGLYLLGPRHLVHSPFPDQIVAVWSGIPGVLINVVFAALLMGKPLPGIRRIWHHAGPQVCFGQTVAWGQYVVGIALTMLVLGPVFGVPVVAGRFERFEPQAALSLMEKMKVKNAFIPPTALRMLKTERDIARRWKLDIRTIGSGGEALGRETYDWARAELGITINEFYGQTECNLVLSSCAALGVTRGGAIGRPVPGHDVAVIDAEGRTVPAGEPGQIAVRRPDPVMFLEYWQNPEATAAKFIGDWMTTGDQGIVDEDGYVHFFGRDDDVITSAGYRIGPGEIEDCLTGHPAVALAAAVGKPDPVRTEIVKAYVVLKEGFEPGDELAAEIGQWVRERLSAHEYPREVEFVDSMPLTTTGKVIRRIFRERAGREAGALSDDA